MFGMFLVVKIVEPVYEVNCERFYTFSYRTRITRCKMGWRGKQSHDFKDFIVAAKKLDQITELSSWLFSDISCFFLPYSERQDIVISH